MRAKNQRRLAIVPKPQEALDIRLVAGDAPAFGMSGVEIPQSIEIGEFGAHASEIVPDPAQDRVDFG